MKYRILLSAAFVALALQALPAQAAFDITGNPGADGWDLTGNSLQNGVYVKGSANYGFDAYSAGITVTSGSVLDISDGANSWLVGDTVLAVGGVFHAVDAITNGWTGAYTGISVNSLLSALSGPKLQAKFGTEGATWAASTTAPDSGDGDSSSADGGLRVQIRSSAYFTPTDWAAGSGQLLELDKDDHILWDGVADPSKLVARMIWNWDITLQQVTSWELLLDVSLLERLYPSVSPFPELGDPAILTVQNGDGIFTDALVQIDQMAYAPPGGSAVPEASSLLIWTLLATTLGAATLRRQLA